MKYNIGQKLPINIEGFMGIEIPCDVKITGINYIIKVDLGNGQFSEMTLNEKELEEKIIGFPVLTYSEKGYYYPSCPYGYNDCVCDPMYIKEHYPEWYKDLGSPTKCEDCVDGEGYDDEDK